MSRISCCIWSTVWLVGVLAGCTPQNAPPPPTASVSGKITLDGKAMAEGEVRFMAPGFPPRPLTIKNGSFSGDAYLGTNSVEIVLEVDGPPSMEDPKVLTKINSVAHKARTAEVTKDGPNTFSFEATSAKAD